MNRRATQTACSLAIFLLRTGCAAHISQPSKPAALGAVATYARKTFENDLTQYRESVAQGRLDSARVQRDAMIAQIEVDVETNYRTFVNHLYQDRASINTGFDVVELGLSAATGLVGGTDVKDMLAASLTAFKGARLSFDKNFFREKTTETLISQMEASRESICHKYGIDHTSRTAD